MEPRYLLIEVVLDLFADLMGCPDEEAPRHLRDRGLLESALERPKTYAHYAGADLALQAAALTHGVAEAQAFIDGNKRIASVCLETFLMLNGHALDAPAEDLAEWILDLAGDLSIDELAEKIRAHLVPAGLR